MPITVRAPDGTLVNFPDGMSDSDITRVMRQNYPPTSAVAPKPKPKKKEDESFLSGVIPTLKGATGDLASYLGLGLEKAAPYIESITGIPAPVFGLVGAQQRKVGQKVKSEAESELPEASLADRRRQQAEIANAKPGTGSEILAGLGRAASRYTDLYYPQLSGVTRDVLPQTAEQAAPVLAKVQAPFGTARGTSEFVASQLPASLIPMGGGKAVQLARGAFLPAAGREAAKAAIAKEVGTGVVLTGGVINATSAGAQAYNDVLEKGGTQEEADRAFKIAAAGAGLVSGAAARMPGLEQLAFAEKPARGGILRSAGRAAIGEAPQEFVEEGGATLATNVAKLGTAAEVPIGEDVLSSGALGAIGGATIAAPIGGLQGAFNRGEAGAGTPPPPASSRPSRPSAPPPAPPADMEALARSLGPVGGKVTLQEPTGPREYTFEGIDEDGSVVLADADGVVFSEDPDQIQAAIKAGAVAPESGLGGMSFGDDITEGLPDVVAPPPPPPPPAAPPPVAAPVAAAPVAAAPVVAPAVEKPKFTIEMPPPSPQNTQRKSQVGKVIFDQENGVGQVPLNQNVKYRGFTAMMRPSKFLELAADLERPKQSSLDYIRQSVDEGKGVGSPFLNLDFETGKVQSHDGRHRMMVIQEKNGDVPVPVHIFGKGEQRARSLDEEKINAFATNLTGEDGRQSSDNFSEAFLDEVAVPVVAPTPVQEPVQPEPVAPPAAPRAVGKAARVTIPVTRQKFDVQYELQDLDNIKFAEDELQNRDRSRPASDEFIRDFVKDFDPDGVGEDKYTDRGAPIINKDNIILSGNGRTMGLQEIYDFNPDQAERYKESLREQGYDIEGIDRPVLVRRLMSDVDERRFVTASNESDVAALSPPEQAAQDASDILTPGVFAKFKGGDLGAAKNDAFVSAFLAEMSPQQRKNVMDDKGKISSQGLKRIENALLYKAYGGTDRASKIFISKAMERNDDDTKTLTNSLVDVSKDWIQFQQAIEAGEIDKKYNITNKLMETIGTASDIKASGNSVAFELRSPDMVEPMDPFVREILLAFHNDDVSRILSRKAIAEKLKAYTEVAAVQQAEPDMLGMSETPSARAIWKRIDDGEGAPQSNMFASIQPISPKRRREILDEGGKVPSLSRGIDKLKKLWADGKINANEFAFEVASYSNFIEDMKNWKRWEDLGKLKVRGPDRIRSVLLDQKRLGNISEEEANFAEWFILRNENLLNDLGISVVKPPKDSSFSGEYDPLSRVMRLIKGRANDNTTVHEIMHHLERMMPQDVRAAIKQAWAKELDKVEVLSYEGKNDNDTLFFQAIRAFHNQEQIKLKDSYYRPSEAFRFATDLIASGKVDGRLYQYVNPSEFWAVNATEIMQGRYDVQGSLLGRLKNWLRELSIKIKGLFKLDSNAPIIKALDSLAKGDGKFVSSQMLEDKIFEYSNIRNSKPVTAIAAAAALASSPVKANINDTPIAPKSALYKSLESGDTKKAIEIIQKSSKNPDARKVASILALNGVGDQKTVILDPVTDLDKAIETLSKNGGDLDDISLVTNGDVRGMILSTPKDKTIYLVKNPDQRRNGVNEQTFLHEAIHAYVKARWSSLGVYTKNNQQALDDRGLYNEEVAAEIKKFNDMWRKFSALVEREYDTGAGIPSTVISAAESPNEALSYLLTNESVQKYAKRVVSDGKGYRLMSEKETGKRSWWDDFVDMLRKIFGMGPARDQFFNDFLDAGNSVLASGKKTKADFRVAGVNEESVSPQKVDNNKQAVQAIINGTPKQMRNAVAKAQKPNDKVIDQGADLQKENRGCD